jgi:two-component system phosphate regulon sensor histidine kinase PhoR
VLDLKELALVIGERAVLPTVGHELRTPLTSIRGYIETVLDGQVDSETTRRFLETARREALRLGRLIDGMLELSMLDLSAPAGGPQCDVVEQIRNTIDMIEPLARRRDVTVRTRLPRSAVARVDGDAYVHALANLLENAVKHGGEHGTVEISSRCVESLVETAVDDDGSGVDPALGQDVFTMGVRGAGERSGSGIGLAVVRAIAQRASGDVRVESSALGGARFILRFPAAGG